MSAASAGVNPLRRLRFFPRRRVAPPRQDRLDQLLRAPPRQTLLSGDFRRVQSDHEIVDGSAAREARRDPVGRGRAGISDGTESVSAMTQSFLKTIIARVSA